MGSLQECDVWEMCGIQKLPNYTSTSPTLFISWLSAKGRRASTIRTCISAISYFYKLINRNPFATFLSRKILDGQAKLDKISTKRKPFTKDLVFKLIDHIQFLTSSTYNRIMLKSLILLLYFCCMRIGEVILSSEARHVLKRKNVTFEGQPLSTCTITLESFKFSRNQSSMIVHKQEDSRYCPVRALKNYVDIRQGPEASQLYLTEQGKPITRNQFSTQLRRLTDLAGLPHRAYSTHSFRSGRTSDLAMNGESTTVIQEIGRWKSASALKHYIKPQVFKIPSA